MRLQSLLLLASLALPATALADTYTTTAVGPGFTAIFPNTGGDQVGGVFHAIGSELADEPLLVYVNGGPATLGGFDFFLGRGGNVNIPNDDNLVFGAGNFGRVALYGPSIITSPPFHPAASNFYIAPSTYNFQDINGVPYTFTVTDDNAVAATPEPSTLALLATSLAGLLWIGWSRSLAAHRRLVLLLLATLALPAVARADNYTIYLTTFTGNGQTYLIPNLGGPLNGTYLPATNQFVTTGYQVITSNPNATVFASADYYLGSGTNFHDLDLTIGSVTTQLYGPSLAVNTGGNNVSANLGAFNLTDGSGDPFTYTVTSTVGPPIPSAPEIDPSLSLAGLTLLAGGAAILREQRSRTNRHYKLYAEPKRLSF